MTDNSAAQADLSAPPGSSSTTRAGSSSITTRDASTQTYARVPSLFSLAMHHLRTPSETTTVQLPSIEAASSLYNLKGQQQQMQVLFRTTKVGKKGREKGKGKGRIGLRSQAYTVAKAKILI